MLESSINCKIHRIHNKSKIISILEKNSLISQSSTGILIGSRAARYYLPDFRKTLNDNNIDWDIIISSKSLLEWLDQQSERIDSIEMIIPKLVNNEQLDLYVYCILLDKSKYDFTIPQSSTSYTAYILDHCEKWINKRSMHMLWMEKENSFLKASPKLLLILKKNMLYYSHQWGKTARDYQRLLTITDDYMTDDDIILCDLFNQYNEKVHEKHSLDTDKFVINSSLTQKSVIIYRDDFVKQSKEEQISSIYHTALSMSISDNILVGLEYICTQGPKWLSDYVINYWIGIQNEKFKQNFEISHLPIKYEINNHCLFSNLSEIPSQRILHYLNDITDFYSMQFVCKQWYTILHQESFWKDLYISRYGKYSGNTNNWKLLYFIKLESQIENDEQNFDQLVNATIQLRKYTVNNVLHLWEDLTHQDQIIQSDILLKINSILFNSFYYYMEKTSDYYFVKILLIGLDHIYTRSKIYLKLRVGEYGSSRFTDHMEELSIEYYLNDNKKQSLKFFSPTLVGFHLGHWGYVRTEDTLLSQNFSTLFPQFPSGIIICLLIMMIHPDHRDHYIKYLKHLEKTCLESISLLGY